MKKIPAIILVILLCISKVSLSQITFIKAYGDSNSIEGGVRILQNLDGDYLVLARALSNGGNGDADFYLVKADTLGNLIWTKKYGGIFPDYSSSFQQTMDGGYILAGTRNQNTSQTNYNAYLVKTDASGDTTWTKSYGGGTQHVSCNSVVQSNDGGYALACNRNIGFLDDDINVIKTNALGNVIWSKTYGEPSPAVEYVNIIRQTSDGGFIVIGDRYVQFLNTRDLFLVKTDSSGAKLWSKTYGGTDAEFAADVHQTDDGGYILAGRTISFGAGGNDIYLVKTDSTGNVVWSKTYGGPNDDLSYTVIQTADGGYMLSCVTTPLTLGCYLIKTNSFGDTLWTRNYSNIGAAYDVKQASDGGYVIPTEANYYDVGLMKTDSNGYSSCNIGSVPNTIAAQNTIVSNTATLVTNNPINSSILPTTVSSGGLLTTICTSVGIDEEASLNSFSIYPNPSSGKFNISFEKSHMKASVEIVNMLGQKVFQNILTSPNNLLEISMDVSFLSKGIYVLIINDGVSVVAGN